MDSVRVFMLTKALELEQINKNKMQLSIVRTKDPTIDALEKDVLAKLASYSTDNNPSNKVKNHLPSDNKTLTPEEAIKELEEMQKKGLI